MSVDLDVKIMTRKRFSTAVEQLVAKGNLSYIDAATFIIEKRGMDYSNLKKLLTDYNGVETGTTYYKFKDINFVSSGAREDGAEGLAGVSASGARAAAVKGDKEAFAQATGAGKLTDALYQAVRKGMSVEEGASGYIPTQKQAKDPRWSHALTKDVRPNTPYKNAKAFHLIGKGKKLTQPMR